MERTEGSTYYRQYTVLRERQKKSGIRRKVIKHREVESTRLVEKGNELVELKKKML
jgi:hypothetical protein